jgi:hypothetical protein
MADALLNENWIKDIIHDMTPALLVQYVMLWILVDATPFNPEDASEDEIAWCITANSEYSARSTYELHFKGSHLPAFLSMVWKVWVCSQCKFFIWLMLQNRIWTTDRLLLREWPNDYFCPLCRQNLETMCHLFQKCSVSHQI